MHRPDLTFGPTGDEWHYERSSRTYDLTRGRSPAWTVGTSQGPVETSISVSPRSTALVIVDMQNYFLHPRCRDHPAGLAAAEKTKGVIEKCRELGIQVIWLNWGLDDDDLAAMPASVQRGFSRSLIQEGEGPGDTVVRLGLGADLGDGQGRCLVAGEWNADIYEPLKLSACPEDVRCDKNRMSGMWSPEQPLRRYLDRCGSAADSGGAGEGERTRTLLFCGVNTDQCVLSTLTDAYNAGWDCILLEDCCATKTPKAQVVCLYNVAGSFGFVTSSEAFLAGKAS
ncbi:Peroxyureidoacrylate/ureidoacrylate amidohydrolase RutB [Colletotrichum tanaceti]|uniref:Peroxyureidoacrylate/ureidoacrylate amidohydrolase RutB n=1 Tax=Colletotrichum tanaceti TaxID=1306861 RepID=A0A4U6XRH1_9PEZI|nr:Peroxyureidoacrylate/ureidoacrylate amidohydrolase RutB [Colletotrichum tanaceti]TKW58434.1 Peroxyureidoacrylate/ureidoacrylate amidohydrolase RutB [Colletotrichum tanaceti]